MKDLIINRFMLLIKTYESYDEIKLEEIRYGLVSIYLSVTKAIFIFSLAWVLGIIGEVIVFTIIYNVIRSTSFGLHATKSWICLLSSTLIFISVPYLCTFISFNMYHKLLLGSICSVLIYKNSPADTDKRPIVSLKRRRVYQLLSTLIAIFYTILSMIVTNNFIENSLIFSLIAQCFVISPYVYRFFHLPYDNYKRYHSTLV